MEVASAAAFPSFYASRYCKQKVLQSSLCLSSPSHPKPWKKGSNKQNVIPSGLPETAVGIALSVVVVGTAATLLVKTNRSSETSTTSSEICGDCGGSGTCSECNGEGFVLKKLTEESAQKARLAAKNMATRYTAGLPKKWSYCSKCSSGRLCITCGGRGRVTV